MNNEPIYTNKLPDNKVYGNFGPVEYREEIDLSKIKISPSYPKIVEGEVPNFKADVYTKGAAELLQQQFNEMLNRDVELLSKIVEKTGRFDFDLFWSVKEME